MKVYKSLSTLFGAFLFLIFVSSCVTTKKASTIINKKNTINSDFNGYIAAIMKKEFNKAMDYMIPEFFEIIPRSQMIDVIEQIFNDPEIDFKIVEPNILDYRKIIKIENKYYTKLTYSNVLKMRFTPTEVESAEEKELRTSYLISAYNEKYGEQNVAYNPETEFYEITEIKDLIGASQNGISDWKFVVVQKEQMAILEKIVPQEIIDMN